MTRWWCLIFFLQKTRPMILDDYWVAISDHEPLLHNESSYFKTRLFWIFAQTILAIKKTLNND
jgi:hypothetical protein